MVWRDDEEENRVLLVIFSLLGVALIAGGAIVNLTSIATEIRQQNEVTAVFQLDTLAAKEKLDAISISVSNLAKIKDLKLLIKNMTPSIRSCKTYAKTTHHLKMTSLKKCTLGK